MPLFAVWAEKEGNDQVVRKVVSSDNDDKVFLPLTADNPEMLKNPDFIEQIKKEFEAQVSSTSCLYTIRNLLTLKSEQGHVGSSQGSWSTHNKACVQ